jgi:hypothetical protein
MASLTRITFANDKVTIGFGISDLQSGNSKAERFEHISKAEIPSRIPQSMRHLEIFLGPQVCDIDVLSFSVTAHHVLSDCPRLESLSVRAHYSSSKWFQQVLESVGKLVQGYRWVSPPLVSFTIHGIVPERRSALVIRRRPGSQAILETSVTATLDTLGEPHVVDELLKFPLALSRMKILPSTSGFSLLRSRNTTLAALTWLLPYLRELTKISLPSELSSDLGRCLSRVSASPHCNNLEIIPPSPPSLPFEIRSLVDQLIEGLHGFNHLRKLCLPASFICVRLLNTLGSIQDLREVKVVAAASSVSGGLSGRSGQIEFPSLRTITVVGSLSELKKIVRVFACCGANKIKRIYVDAERLDNEREMRRALHCIVTHCPGLMVLGIRIRGVHRSENARWMNLSHLGELPKIRELVIQHPRPLPLVDSQICDFLQKWPFAEIVSFNPSPSLPPWSTPSGTILHPPTFGCLVEAVGHGRRLRHFGVYLNPRATHPAVDPALSTMSLRELDLGTSGFRRRSKDFAKRLFPNAKLL